jgi:predicted transcriptional regulator
MNAKSADVGDLLSLTAKIVASHVANNKVAVEDLALLIEKVFATLSDAANGGGVVGPGPLKPKVPIKRPITPDYLICLEDGKKLKMLKRHLMTSYNMTPEQYRDRWGLPGDYPMVAPNYANQRRVLAKRSVWALSAGENRKDKFDPATVRR